MSHFRLGLIGRLWAGFAVIGVLMLVLAGLGVYSSAVTSETTANVKRQTGNALQTERMAKQLALSRLAILYASQVGGDGAWTKAFDELQKTLDLQNALVSTIATPSRNAMARDIVRLTGEYRGRVQALQQIRMISDPGSPEVRAAVDAAAAVGVKVIGISNDLTQQIREAAEKTTLAAEADAAWSSLAAKLIGGGALLLAVTLGALLGRSISKPIKALTSVMHRLAEGDLTVVPSGVGRHDEIGDMARAVAVFKQHAEENHRLQDEQARQREQAENDRRDALRAMADTVESEAGRAVEQVAARTGDMARNADSMANSASDVTANSQSVAAAAEQALANAQGVASATEELAASIREISTQISQSTTIIARAVHSGEDARNTIRSLSDAVSRVGEVVNLIQEIAGQTNLLALNATIEAARAGEAGKGFAVVAGEVKNLATQTARSTEEITRQINDIQSATEMAVTAVSQIGRAIDDVNEISAAIAAAMEEQAAATQEISRNVVETTNASHEVSSRIAEVSRIADATGEQANAVRHEMTLVNGAIEELRRVLVRVVRTSTSDADRRGEERIASGQTADIDIAGQRQAVEVVNISRGGAQLTGCDGLRVGGRGVLLARAGGGRAGFVVLSSDAGATHVRFDADAAGVERLVAALTGGQGLRQDAA